MIYFDILHLPIRTYHSSVLPSVSRLISLTGRAEAKRAADFNLLEVPTVRLLANVKIGPSGCPCRPRIASSRSFERIICRLFVTLGERFYTFHQIINY
jgi:hypothetical protein